MKKVLVLAYQISPYRGSEYSVAWNYVTNMSKNNELVVVYGASGNHLGDTEELQEYIKEHPLPNVTFIPIKPNTRAERLNQYNKKGKLVYSFYFAFHEWHKQVYAVAKNLVREQTFDVIHYITPIGYREPGFMWKLGLPYIWGPVGGAYSVPKSLVKALDNYGKLKLGFRKIINNFQLKYKSSIRKALKKTDVFLAATTYDQQKFSKHFKKEVYYLPENCISEKIETHPKDFYSKDLKLVWIGSIDERKALIILLDALIKVKNKENIQLDVVGNGHLKEKLMTYAKENNINHLINWHGAVPRTEVMEILSTSHLSVLTGITEGNPTTVWEAMARQVPSLSLDHCGMHDIIDEKSGIKIQINSYEQVIEDIAKAIDYYAVNRAELENLSKEVALISEKYKWENRISFWENMYDLAIKNRKKNFQKK